MTKYWAILTLPLLRIRAMHEANTALLDILVDNSVIERCFMVWFLLFFASYIACILKTMSWALWSFRFCHSFQVLHCNVSNSLDWGILSLIKTFWVEFVTFWAKEIRNVYFYLRIALIYNHVTLSFIIPVMIFDNSNFLVFCLVQLSKLPKTAHLSDTYSNALSNRLQGFPRFPSACRPQENDTVSSSMWLFVMGVQEGLDRHSILPTGNNQA